MAKKDIARLTAAEHRELASWARRYGGAWKKMLRTSRESGRLEGPALSAFNKIGPSGLIAYRLTMAPTENPHRACACKVANPRGIPRDSDSLYRMERVSLDAGGYDRFGEYFGRGAPLYAVTSPDGDVFHVRGGSRAAAMANFREEYKYRHSGKHRTARFYGEGRKVANPSKKPRKSRASGVTVAARRVKRAAAKHGVKLSAKQIAEARRERVFSYGADPLETRAAKLARMRSYSPEFRAMLASRADYEGENFDPRRPDTSLVHSRFMGSPKLPIRNPSRRRKAPKRRTAR